MIAGPLDQLRGRKGGIALQPVRLVLLLLVGPRQGENDFVEFPSVEDAIAYGCQIQDEQRFQLDGIEDGSGKSLMAFDELNERCRSQNFQAQRNIAVGEN